LKVLVGCSQTIKWEGSRFRTVADAPLADWTDGPQHAVATADAVVVRYIIPYDLITCRKFWKLLWVSNRSQRAMCRSGVRGSHCMTTASLETLAVLLWQHGCRQGSSCAYSQSALYAVRDPAPRRQVWHLTFAATPHMAQDTSAHGTAGEEQVCMMIWVLDRGY
jgi:hypothetical protein